MPYVGQKPADIISTAVDTVTGKFSGEVDAASLDISGNIDVDGTTNLDVVDIDGAVDMASTLGVTGVVTANAGVVVDNITIDGTEIDLSSGDLTIDVAGEIILDADGGKVNFNDATTNVGQLILSSNGGDFIMSSRVSDKDIVFSGNDGGSITEFMRIDSSDAGTAVFNHDIKLNDAQMVRFGSSQDSDIAHYSDNQLALRNTTGVIDFYTGGTPTERLRILADGRIAHGATSALAGAHFTQTFNSVNGTGINLNSVDASGNAHALMIFTRNGATVGSISTNANSTAYNTSSDYRLKENVTTSWDATTRLKQLKPSRFNFIADADTTVDGFLAHEVSSIVPEAISGTKDGTEDITNVILNADGTVNSDGVSQSDWTTGKLAVTDGDGNTIDPIYASDTTWVASKTIPKYQAIDQSKIVPLLTKALQEQQATIEALTARIVTLENA
jgi:hypothetical protein